MTDRLPDFLQPPLPADQRVLRKVRLRVLTQIAESMTAQHLTVRTGAGDWQPLLEGIECKVLREDEASMSYLLRLAPGATLPAHRHEADEECVVLEGELRIGEQLIVQAGDYHLAKAGLLHAPITSDTGAVIFLRGTPPDSAHLL